MAYLAEVVSVKNFYQDDPSSNPLVKCLKLGQWLWLSQSSSCVQHQNSEVRIQSSEHLFSVNCVENTKLEKRGREWPIKINCLKLNEKDLAQLSDKQAAVVQIQAQDIFYFLHRKYDDKVKEISNGAFETAFCQPVQDSN